MPVLDFKEIPIPTVGATRDQFELFAREFLEFMGFKVIVGPDRGPDGGRDLVVQETRTGVAGETQIKWLVSCKHKAHSGASVTPEDESDIYDRVRTHACQGFLGFYSTIPSSGLAIKLNAPTLQFEVQVYDPEKIERHLLTSSSGLALAKRFFPKSLVHWQKEHPTPAKIFREEPALFCWHCKKSLLLPKPHGIVVVWTTLQEEDHPRREHTEHVYWCCKGRCDSALEAHYGRQDLTDGWEDIPDLLMPIAYIRWVMTMFNEFHRGMTYSADALANSKKLLLNLFPLICRDMTEEENERINRLAMIPPYLAGWGYEG
jgi:restriction endonuclease